MSRLKKVEKYAIQWLSSQGHEILDIANELNLPEETVKNCVEKYKQTNTDNNIKTSSSTVGGAKNKNLMITETFGKKNKGVTIMTPEASSVGDESRKSSPQQKSHRDKSAIFNPIKKQ